MRKVTSGTSKIKPQLLKSSEQQQTFSMDSPEQFLQGSFTD